MSQQVPSSQRRSDSDWTAVDALPLSQLKLQRNDNNTQTPMRHQDHSVYGSGTDSGSSRAEVRDELMAAHFRAQQIAAQRRLFSRLNAAATRVLHPQQQMRASNRAYFNRTTYYRRRYPQFRSKRYAFRRTYRRFMPRRFTGLRSRRFYNRRSYFRANRSYRR